MCIAVSGVNLIAVGRAEGVGWAGGEGCTGETGNERHADEVMTCRRTKFN